MAKIPIKTPEEINAMTEGGKILRRALDETAEAVRPGVSTWELNELAEKIIAETEGAKPGFKGYKGFPAALCTSINDEVVHGIPSKDVVLEEGDIIGIDCGVFYKGLYTDACVTVIAGDADPEIRRFVKVTKQTLKRAMGVVKEGCRVGDISAVIQKNLESQGYASVVECTGHGVGKHLHEDPEIANAGRKGTGPELKAGMTIAIEPISSMGSGEVMTAEDGWTVITADGSHSAHFEHTILVTKKGYEIIV